MLGWLRKKNRSDRELRRRYATLLQEARDLQRRGDIRGFAEKSAAAEAVLRRLQAVEVTEDDR